MSRALYRKYQFVRNGWLPDPVAAMTSHQMIRAHMRAHQAKQQFSQEVEQTLWEEATTSYGAPTERVCAVPTSQELARAMEHCMKMSTITMPTELHGKGGAS